MEGFEQLVIGSNFDFIESLGCCVESRLRLTSGEGSNNGRIPERRKAVIK